MELIKFLGILKNLLHSALFDFDRNIGTSF